jgi:uncharacterized protein YfaP (DUF2135 family)
VDAQDRVATKEAVVQGRVGSNQAVVPVKVAGSSRQVTVLLRVQGNKAPRVRVLQGKVVPDKLADVQGRVGSTMDQVTTAQGSRTVQVGSSAGTARSRLQLARSERAGKRLSIRLRRSAMQSKISSICLPFRACAFLRVMVLRQSACVKAQL